MLDQIIGQLKNAVGQDLTGKLGIDAAKVDGILKAAGDSVKDSVGQGLDLSAALNLFSKDANNAGADALLGNLGQSFLGKLTGQLGFDAAKAGSIKDMVLPALTNLLSDKVAGNKDALAGLLGGKDLLGEVAGKLGGLGKLFGRG
ncbi:MAG: hypothetical protein ACK4L7_02650 [Flavobacteriales bacterium]